MMEFLGFLTAQDKEILNLIYKAQYSVEENTPLCLLGKRFFGFLKRKQKTVVICTQNAKDVSGYSMPKFDGDYDRERGRAKLYITRALRHEAIHVAQDCNNGNLLKIFNKNNSKLHPFKIDALKGSTAVSGNRDKEYEAYFLEDKPKVVISSLKKFCF